MADKGRFDLLIRGGRVIDPASGLDAASDIAIADGKIAAVGLSLPSAGAERVIDVAGLVVTPGIVDMHCHVFATHARSTLSLPPEANTLSGGVTTVVDAGTSGWRDFPDLKATVIDRSKLRVLAFVNIVGQGMAGDPEQDPSEMQPRLAAEVAREYPDIVVGIKTAHYWTHEPWDDVHEPWAAVDRAVEAGEASGLPVMVDFWPRPPERTYPDLILKHLRPGDIHTHVFAQQFAVLDAAGRVSDFLRQARDRGVLFDLGHGAGSFWFRNAAPAIEQGFVPDTISTDLHTGNVNGPVFSMLTTMNKVMNLGVPLADVIARSTVAPARLLRRPELGTLSLGAAADVAVFELQSGQFPFVDCGKAKIVGDRRLECVLTVRAGEILYNPRGLGLPLWRDAPPAYWRVPALQAEP